MRFFLKFRSPNFIKQMKWMRIFYLTKKHNMWENRPETGTRRSRVKHPHNGEQAIERLMITFSTPWAPVRMSCVACAATRSPAVSSRSNWTPASAPRSAPSTAKVATWESNHIWVVRPNRAGRCRSSRWSVRSAASDMGICCLKFQKSGFCCRKERKREVSRCLDIFQKHYANYVIGYYLNIKILISFNSSKKAYPNA